jgi:hypothetical protein
MKAASAFLSEINQAEAAAATLHSTTRGALRLNISPTLANHVGTLIGEYVLEHPQTSFELITADRMGEFVEDGFDLAIRADTPPDSNLISRRLGSASWSLCASSPYPARRGEPFQPADLAAHNCLIYASATANGLSPPARERMGSMYPAACAATTSRCADCSTLGPGRDAVARNLGCGRSRRLSSRSLASRLFCATSTGLFRLSLPSGDVGEGPQLRRFRHRTVRRPQTDDLGRTRDPVR